MLPIPQIQINIVQAFIEHVQTLYVDDPYQANRLIQVLKIYEWQLRRSIKPKPANPDQMATLKHGIRTAENILEDIHANESERMQGWRMGCNAQNEPQKLANLLWKIVMSFTAEVQANEALYPALKSMFDGERAAYRRMKEDAEAERSE